jgi:hypothetical protein
MRTTNMMRLFFTMLGAALLTLAWSSPSQADAVTFTGTSGTLAASAEFTVSGTTLTVELCNISTADVLNPAQLLSAVFFSVDPTCGTLTPTSAVVSPGSTVLFPPSTPIETNVGGEFAYATGLSGAPNGANSGISSAGFDLFGSGNFNGPNLQGPVAVDGLQYGLTSAGDNPATGNAAVTGNNALIKNCVTFTIGVTSAFESVAHCISNVSFQYGTALTDTNIPGIPEPSSLAIAGLGALGFVGYGLRRRVKK